MTKAEAVRKFKTQVIPNVPPYWRDGGVNWLLVNTSYWVDYVMELFEKDLIDRKTASKWLYESRPKFGPDPKNWYSPSEHERRAARY